MASFVEFRNDRSRQVCVESFEVLRFIKDQDNGRLDPENARATLQNVGPALGACCSDSVASMPIAASGISPVDDPAALEWLIKECRNCVASAGIECLSHMERKCSLIDIMRRFCVNN